MSDETSNHGYRRPSPGTANWHVPLNENFGRIDTHVEVRDEGANREDYEPKQGAKFLATDTGTVYVGDGDRWQMIGSLAATATAIDGTIIARPGELQEQIDDASRGSDWGESPIQTVRLVSGETYEIADTVRLRRNVRLECNGARIVPTGDFNIFELYRGTRLIEPFCDTRDVDWSSIQIVVSPQDAESLGKANTAQVERARLLGTPGEGIGLQFRGGDNPCSTQRASGTISGFNLALDIRAAGSDTSSDGAWSNGNWFSGRVSDYRVGVSMRSDGAAVSGNVVQIQAQPLEGVSEWLWRMSSDPRDDRGDSDYVMKGNTVVAHPWDTQYYENDSYRPEDRRAPVWFIGRGPRYGNSLWDLSGVLSNEHLVNNSDNPNRNGVFTSHGGFVTGTSQFRASPIYEPNSEARWHRDSANR